MAAEVPEAFLLMQNWPNPFNTSTTVSYILPISGHARLSVHNLFGQEVITLVEGYQEAGLYQVHWEGRDWTGQSVASGVYVYRLQAGGFEAVKRMILVR